MAAEKRHSTQEASPGPVLSAQVPVREHQAQEKPVVSQALGFPARASREQE